jgi:sigma-E factor negative regulatory protein RseC
VQIEESGTVVELRERTALVRLRRSSACAGCASAGRCHTGPGEREQLLEAWNEAGAVVGESVRVAVPAKAVLGASARIYLLPVGGLLAGAAVAQVLASAFISAPAGETAAGIGGIAGAVAAVLLGRKLRSRPGNNESSLPRIIRVVAGVDSSSRGG